MGFLTAANCKRFANSQDRDMFAPVNTAARIVSPVMLVVSALLAGPAEAAHAPLSLTPNFSWVNGVRAGVLNRFNGFSGVTRLFCASDPAHPKFAQRLGVRQSSGAFKMPAAASPASEFRIYAAKNSSELDRSNAAPHHPKIVTTI